MHVEYCNPVIVGYVESGKYDSLTVACRGLLDVKRRSVEKQSKKRVNNESLAKTGLRKDRSI